MYYTNVFWLYPSGSVSQRTNCILGIFISVYLSIGFFEPFEKRYADAAAIPKIISGTSSTRDPKVRVLKLNMHRYKAD